MLAVTLLVVQSFIIDRLAGVDYPFCNACWFLTVVCTHILMRMLGIFDAQFHHGH